MAALSTDKYYGHVKSLSLDIAQAYNTEFKDLASRGLDMVQITEPLTFFEPWIIEAINTALAKSSFTGSSTSATGTRKDSPASST